MALITSATRGIGLEIARAMAGSGAYVILNGRDTAALNVAVRELQENGGSANALPFDVADADALKNAFAEIAARHDRLDILVSNAGLRDRKLSQDFSDADLQRMFDANLITPYRLAPKATALMRPQRSGRMIFVTSIAWQIARSGDSVYKCTKQDVTDMMRARRGIWSVGYYQQCDCARRRGDRIQCSDDRGSESAGAFCDAYTAGAMGRAGRDFGSGCIFGVAGHLLCKWACIDCRWRNVDCYVRRGSTPQKESNRLQYVYCGYGGIGRRTRFRF